MLMNITGISFSDDVNISVFTQMSLASMLGDPSENRKFSCTNLMELVGCAFNLSSKSFNVSSLHFDP